MSVLRKSNERSARRKWRAGRRAALCAAVAKAYAEQLEMQAALRAKTQFVLDLERALEQLDSRTYAELDGARDVR